MCKGVGFQPHEEPRSKRERADTVMQIVFWILTDAHLLNPNSKLTYAHPNIGIPNLIFCAEMVPFSILFHYAYSYRLYVIGPGSTSATESDTGERYFQSYQGCFLGIRAWLETFDPEEIFSAVVFAPRVVGNPPKNPTTGATTGCAKALTRSCSLLPSGNIRREEDLIDARW